MQNFIASPLNYTGGKFKLLSQILPHFPKKIETFYDVFCGGCNVGINIKAKKNIYNDLNQNLISLLETFKFYEKDKIFNEIFNVIEKYNLSNSAKFRYSHYDCNSSNGLGKFNKNGFLRLRNDFNNGQNSDFNKFIKLFVLIIFSFNNQIRFNKFNEFNLPVGKRDFNVKMQEKLSKFIDKIQAQNSNFFSQDFFEFKEFQKDDFVYADPPYLITRASYNENGGWSNFDELRLLDFLDNLDQNGIKFALSNVLQNKGKKNIILEKWLENGKFKVVNLKFNYSNSNYQTKNKNLQTDEILVLNY